MHACKTQRVKNTIVSCTFSHLVVIGSESVGNRLLWLVIRGTKQNRLLQFICDILGLNPLYALCEKLRIKVTKIELEYYLRKFDICD